MVEKKDLISVADVQYGYPFESSLFTEDENFIPLIRIRDVKPGLPSTYYSGEYSSEFIIRKGDILVGMDGEFNLAKWKSRDGLLNQRVLKLSGKNNICNSGYLYHYMGPVFKKIELQTAGGSVKHLSAKVINKIQIPIPPLSEQNRIVGILDTFTESIENLKKQITERKKQYEYYRDQLLDLEGKPGVEMKTLGEMCLIKTGNKPKTIFEKGKYRYINAGTSESGYTNETNCEANVVTTPSRGQGGIGFLAFQPVDFWLGPLCYQIRSIKIEVISNKYLYYYLSGHNDEILKYKSEGGTPAVNAADLKKIPVLYPSLSEQSRIVSILDTFEASISNLEQQLTHRQKQYEYYRNMLLTFDE